MRKQGFSLIELLVVISIIAILATLILPGLTRAKITAKETTARTEISSFDQALSMYQADFGAYPAEETGNSSKTLVDSLKGDAKATPPRKPYFNFKKDRIINGEYQSPLYKPYYYRENASEKTKTDDMKKPFEYDIWTEDSKKKPDGINNWD
ncbi:MAG: prepilin-type N-terminal cleavage/methylation domain-containing protein [Planctomycetes bacterium]|nr:prepilin-type N-terminal cleavage/methylation domain-containing protein [Planctomycetota bacterium]